MPETERWKPAQASVAKLASLGRLYELQRAILECGELYQLSKLTRATQALQADDNNLQEAISEAGRLGGCRL